MSILKVQDFPTDPTTAVFTGAEPVNSVFAGPASGAASAPAFRPLVPDDIPSGVKLINANYTVTGADNGLLLVSNVSGSITVTLPNPPPLSSFDISIENPTPGALSISPNGLLLDGSASSLSVSKNQGLYIATDGVNYYSQRGMGTGGGGGGTPGGTTGQLQYNSSGAFAGAAGSSVAASGAIGLGAAPAAGYDLDVTSSAANGGTVHVAKQLTVDATAQAVNALVVNSPDSSHFPLQINRGSTSYYVNVDPTSNKLEFSGGSGWNLQYDGTSLFVPAGNISALGGYGIFYGFGTGTSPASGYDLDVTSSSHNGGTAHVAKSLTVSGSPATVSLDLTGSSTSSPALIQGTGSGVLRFGDGWEGMQMAPNAETQIFSYWGLRLQGQRNTTPPAFISSTANDPSVTIDAPMGGTGPTLLVNGVANFSASPTVTTPSGTNASVTVVESGTPGNFCQMALVEVGANYFTDAVVADGVVRATTGKSLRLGTGVGVSSLVLSGGKVTGVSGVATVGMGVPAIVAFFSAALSGSTSYTGTLLATAPVGDYRVSAIMFNTSTVASTTISLTVTFRANAATITLTVCPPTAVTTGNTYLPMNNIVFRHDDATQNITYTVTSTVAGTVIFTHLYLERLV